MITTAKNDMVSELKNLWKLCFHDEDSYINFYYENRFKADETLVYLVENQVVAMLTLMPGFVVHKEEKLPIRYVYAVATHPDHRRKGYAAALIDYANQTREKDYIGTFLVPASETLYQYYEAHGYQTVNHKKVLYKNMEDFCNDLKHFDGKHEVKCVAPLVSEDFYELRAKAYTEAGFVSWEQEDLDYLLKEFLYLGGQALKVMLEKEDGALLYYEDKDNLVIKETTLSDEGLYTAVKYLNAKNKYKHLTVILPKHSTIEAEEAPFAMAHGKGFCDNEYVNLALD
jgi:predicted acetyltransferase